MTLEIKDLSDSNSHCPLPAPKKGSYFQSTKKTKEEHSFYSALLKQGMRQIFRCVTTEYGCPQEEAKFYSRFIMRIVVTF